MSGILATCVRAIVPPALRPQQSIERQVARASGSRVMAGPFAGMTYVLQGVGSVMVPKLLGIYEREIRTFVEEAVAASPRRLVIVGAGEGYYAVGLLRRCPEARAVAFEASARARESLAQVARLNGVDARIDVRGTCEPEGLAAAVGDGARTLVVCDVEGAERELLSPEAVPGLRSAHVLVELHEQRVPGIVETIAARFPHHRFERREVDARGLEEYPFRTPWRLLAPGKLRRYALSEEREEVLSWGWLVPRAAVAPVPGA